MAARKGGPLHRSTAPAAGLPPLETEATQGGTERSNSFLPQHLLSGLTASIVYEKVDNFIFKSGQIFKKSHSFEKAPSIYHHLQLEPQRIGRRRQGRAEQDTQQRQVHYLETFSTKTRTGLKAPADNLLTMVNRWTCKYCDLTINDDVPSRAAHEGGFRHKAAVERALRQTYKKAEKGRREAAVQAREIAKIERAALKADAQDAAGPSEAAEEEEGEGQAGAKRKRSHGKDKEDQNGRAEWKPKDKFAAYTTAANLGLGEDPEEVRAREEKELRQKEGFASGWSVVEDPNPPSISSSSSQSATAQAKSHKPIATFDAVDDQEDLRSFKTQEKTAPRLADDEDEPAGELVFKKRTKKRRM